jgi:hypothetical protein
MRIMAKPITTTNRFLKDPLLREKMVLKSVASSSAIEGIRAPFKKAAASSFSTQPQKKRAI